MFTLTTLAPKAIDTLTGVALKSFDGDRPDGIAKEIIVRLAALNVINGHDDASELRNLYDGGVYPLTLGDAGVIPNAVTNMLSSSNRILIPDGADANDAVIAVHAIIKDVCGGNQRLISTIPPSESAIKALGKGKVKPGSVKPSIEGANVPAAGVDPDGAPDPEAVIASITSLDLDAFLSDENAFMRPLVTRLVGKFYPDAFNLYRSVKDNGTATAKRDAYAFMLAAFRKLFGTDAPVGK